MKTQNITIFKIVSAIASGILFTLSFPGADISYLAWFALIPLMMALNGSSLKQGFYLGFCAGLSHYLSLLYWLAYTMNTYGNLNLSVCISILFLMAAYLALYFAFFSALITKLKISLLKAIFFIPCLWVVLEYIRSFIFSGFPWELIGYTQYKQLGIIQISDIFGVYGVSFLVILCNTAIYMIICYLTGYGLKKYQIKKKPLTISIFLVCLIFSSVWLYGKWRIKSMYALIHESPSVKTMIVQGNIDQAVKWNSSFQRTSVAKYLRLSQPAKEKKPDIVIWPETATPFYFLYNTQLSGVVRKGIKDIGTDFLIGSPSFISDNTGVHYHNSAFLINGRGKIKGKYDKAHLVPFGEYVPLRKWFPFLGKMVENVGDFQPGRKGKTILWKKYRLGVQICYEIIFPPLSRLMVKNNANLLVNLTNDAWYGRSSAPWQHFSMSVFRAIENRRSLVRAANTGISGFIDPVGRIIASTKLFKDATVTRSVPVIKYKSVYTRFGDLFSWVCVLLTLIGIFSGGLQIRNKII